jgi:hypothetical protein
MKIIQKSNEDRVRIVIGKTRVGFSGLSKPIKSITLSETNVDEVYSKIIKYLKSLTNEHN